MKREPLINFRSMTPPPRCSGSSHARSSSREGQPGDAQPDPVLQDVVNCLMSISNQMWRSEGSDKNGGWPWFNGTCKDYPAFWRRWSSYEECYHQLTPQTELVRLFREKCMSKEIARYSGIGGTMAKAWAKLDRIYRNDRLFCAELRQEIQACPRIEEEEYEKQLDHYVLIQNNIDEADKENLGDLFLDLDGIEEITQAFSSREKSLWRGIQEHMQP